MEKGSKMCVCVLVEWKFFVRLKIHPPNLDDDGRGGEGGMPTCFGVLAYDGEHAFWLVLFTTMRRPTPSTSSQGISVHAVNCLCTLLVIVYYIVSIPPPRSVRFVRVKLLCGVVHCPVAANHMRMAIAVAIGSEPQNPIVKLKHEQPHMVVLQRPLDILRW